MRKKGYSASHLQCLELGHSCQRIKLKLRLGFRGRQLYQEKVDFITDIALQELRIVVMLVAD